MCKCKGKSFWENFYLKVELTSLDAKIPEKANHDDAGYDVFSPIDVTIEPRGDVLIPLDFKTEFPKGFALIFKEKSGRATKLKLDIGACVVDAGYRGIVHVHMFNNSDATVKIPRGEKLAQFVIVPTWFGKIEKVDSVNTDTNRGEGGFGSTGV